MRTIIAGSRHLTDIKSVARAVESCGWVVTEIVSGGARGADALGEAYALARGIPIRVFPADWRRHERAAGPYRNRQMARYAQALVAVWDGASPGTADMIRAARSQRLRVHVVLI